PGGHGAVRQAPDRRDLAPPHRAAGPGPPRGGRLGTLPLDQLQPVAERVADVDARAAVLRLADLHVVPGRAQTRGQLVEAVHDQPRMRLARRVEVGVDAEVDLDRAALEPGAAA